ncbi:MAG: photosynthetic complex putative assembly protein PuhB [Aestuariivita sp.]|nr:photosynthetic complex putative assembly protein PuhB [Aestuariivita sp.]
MFHDELEIEPIEGLPELLPEGEVILWQGRPQWWVLAWESLSLPWVIGYFLLLTAWHFISVIDQMSFGLAVGVALPFLILGLVVIALFLIVGFLQARAALYTVTNRRVVMRIGAALTVTLNLPYNQIVNASLRDGRWGTGTIALETMGEARLSYLVCWPHVRPWYMSRTQPALRAIPEPDKVARIVADAAQSRTLETPDSSKHSDFSSRLMNFIVPAE